ncbi:MAG TPA: class I SAM-dependent methyltransferase [Nitrospirae bacterium]|nr:class I SAM-dependent methyltransferase [Nitrospirota bacterium]
MPRISMIPTFLREITGTSQMPREPEPDLVMDSEDQVLAYAEAGRINGVMSAAYLFHTARISAIISEARHVVDLGCGPATQLAQIAQHNPKTSFLGVDLSEKMLADGKAHCSRLGLTNVQFMRADITDLNEISDHNCDAVLSTMALHHLPTIDHLAACFKEIKRILKPGGGLYLTDFSRLKYLKSILFFAYLNRKHQPHIFSLDYERSLRAAFLRSDFDTLVAQIFDSDIRTFCTFGIPILQIVKSLDGKISPETRERLKTMRKQLPTRYRRELDDIRFFFWQSGLRNDPFR